MLTVSRCRLLLFHLRIVLSTCNVLGRLLASENADMIGALWMSSLVGGGGGKGC